MLYLFAYILCVFLFRQKKESYWFVCSQCVQVSFFLERSMWSTQQPNNSRKRKKHSFQSITQKHLPSLLLFVCIYVPHTQTLMIARIECHGFYQHTNTCEHGLMQPSIWWPADMFLYWIFYVHYINWSAFLHIAPQHSINDLQTIAKRASF